MADASEVNDGVSVNCWKRTTIGSEGEAFLLYTLEMGFDTDGTLTNYLQPGPTTDWKFIGAEDSPTLAFNFGLDANGDPSGGAVTHCFCLYYSSLDQNGYGVGNLTSVTVKVMVPLLDFMIMVRI